MDSTQLTKPLPSTLQKVLLTQRSFATRLLCAEADADISNWGISNPVWVYDNEPRNREIVERTERQLILVTP